MDADEGTVGRGVGRVDEDEDEEEAHNIPPPKFYLYVISIPRGHALLLLPGVGSILRVGSMYCINTSSVTAARRSWYRLTSA